MKRNTEICEKCKVYDMAEEITAYKRTGNTIQING
jgi:hypothetical protein